MAGWVSGTAGGSLPAEDPPLLRSAGDEPAPALRLTVIKNHFFRTPGAPPQEAGALGGRRQPGNSGTALGQGLFVIALKIPISFLPMHRTSLGAWMPTLTTLTT